MHVLVIGHWQKAGEVDIYDVLSQNAATLDGQGCDEQREKRQDVERIPSSRQALDALERGLREYDPTITTQSLLFGGGVDFADALAQKDTHTVGISIPLEASEAYDLGVQTSALIRMGQCVVIEGGHGVSATLWPSFLAGALGWEHNALSIDSSVEDVAAALESLRMLWGDHPAQMVVSTARALVGLSSVVATNPDLSARIDVTPAQGQHMRKVFARAYRRLCPQLLSESVDPASIPGSGAGGGIGAIFAALGVTLVPTGEYLRRYFDLDELMGRNIDLVVVTHPGLHSPLLAESVLDSITEAAGVHALPVVAVGVDSSLSRHECAQWGLHGTLLSADMEEAVKNVGTRIAHTWARRLKA